MVEKEISKQGIVKYISTIAARKAARLTIKAIPLKKTEFEKAKVKKILFIQLYGIGDYLMSTPAIKAISDEFPKAKKILLCKKHSLEIAKLNPCIDTATADIKKIKKIDLAISLNDSAESSIIAFKLKPKYLIGFLKGKTVGANFEIKGFSANEKNSWVENYLLIPKAMKINAKNQKYVLDLKKIKRSDKIFSILKKNKISTFVVLNPNTREGAEAKNWGNKNYAALAEKLIERGHKVVFCGGKDEDGSKKTIELIQNKKVKEKIIDLTGKVSLDETACLFSKVRLFVGNDTGLMHISLAVGCSTIGIFGPTNSKILFPKNGIYKKAFAFQIKNGEWPCYFRGPFNVKQNQKYMDSIAPSKVFKKATELMK
ncbi:MAG: glycosyltransferase family 9 protein [Candidatus Diapherotrites archaeon]|nr:glycosyltransferase family 9 protein [Candidatus Diapherotrites archaeon]